MLYQATFTEECEPSGGSREVVDTFEDEGVGCEEDIDATIEERKSIFMGLTMVCC